MKKNLFLTLGAVLAGFPLLGAQEAVQVGEVPPAVVLPVALDRIVRSELVDTLLVNHMDYRLKFPDEGYRILIFSQSGNHSKNAAIQAKSDFDLIYPECKTYISFEEPYFKVKVGNFTDRMEADFFLRTIKADYPYAFIVKDVLDVADYLELGK